jgi:hypothetical protein
MKTINIIFLWCQLRAIEATLYGQEEMLSCVRDPATINRIHMARINARREWHRVKGRYLEALRERNPWRITLTPRRVRSHTSQPSVCGWHSGSDAERSEITGASPALMAKRPVD